MEPQRAEIIWPGSGGGSCATGIAKPSWQHDPGCKYRTQNDVAAVAVDVAIYDSYDYSGWITAAEGSNGNCGGSYLPDRPAGAHPTASARSRFDFGKAAAVAVSRAR